ncbi:2-octaprenyl-3-methyl-6-methoxy-1,4-benzoquinol hydroxylase [Pseudoxanthomonas kalamensis DSM 18571]|uniref:UbiH/UbiF family hydroxylase n=1 Tax=Pseudoxanthomonas kalamensis TaxID=289483 RepID=UPI001391B8DB|nr:UbiH/UbiF family hydroxylase [Pseudoxanthomonas kalamensis]KAF1711139.1 2-octaprenyl-3-methyl-6-methoxy-1,4-benzoquinol hydroxylase [Pseudoxanthomonas kalamensis DSM 18571]
MSRRARLDAVVVGGGVVGAASARMLAQQGLAVALVEGRPPPTWSAQSRDLRVYAFAPDNAALLQRLGAWDAVRSARAPAYRRMRVWDAGCPRGELVFDADALGRTELGWIVENDLLVDRLWAGLDAAGVELRCPARVEALEQDDEGVRLRLDDGSRLDARVAIAADGAASTLRTLAGIEVDAHDYRQRGVVAFIDTEHPHEATAWQRFLPSGPLAFLPFEGCCSIVWTLPEHEAERVLALDEAAFDRELTAAFAARLGQTRLASKRAAFPLRRQTAEQFLAGRVLLVGDAAHAVHPLAGQGVNLGLRDVSALEALLQDAQARKADWAAPHRLARWARTRRSESVLASKSFSAINRLFSNDEPHLTLARGPLLATAGKLPPLSQLFWRKASGL